MIFDINKVVYKDLSGREYPGDLGVAKAFGDFIYISSVGRSLRNDEMARAIFNGKEIEVDEDDLDELMRLANSIAWPVSPMIKTGLNDYILSLKK